MDRSRLSGGNRNPSNNSGKRPYDKINHVDCRYDLELWQQLEREVEANRQLAQEWEGSPESILSFCLSGSRNSNIPRSGEVERFPSGSSAIAHGRDGERDAEVYDRQPRPKQAMRKFTPRLR
jgi:hypothetical protein